MPTSHQVKPGFVAAIWTATASAVGSMISVIGTRMATQKADMYRRRLLWKYNMARGRGSGTDQRFILPCTTRVKFQGKHKDSTSDTLVSHGIELLARI